jgi:hypothetical protein
MNYLIAVLSILLLSVPSFALEKTVNGVVFSIIPIPTSRLKAFYAGRGFSEKQIEPYAKTCVFTTFLRNDDAKGTIHFVRKNWMAISKAKVYHIRNNDYWFRKFQKTKVKMSSKIAFELGQIPEEQSYAPGGDWNEGMLSVDLPHGSKFDIKINWDIKGKRYELTIKNITCAK